MEERKEPKEIKEQPLPKFSLPEREAHLKELHEEMKKYGFFEKNFPSYKNLIREIEKVDVIGFDLDFTLAIYNQKTILDLIYECIAKNLVEELGWPADIATEKSKQEAQKFTFKDILIDFKNGVAFRLSQKHDIIMAYYGTKKMNKEELDSYRKKMCPEGKPFAFNSDLLRDEDRGLFYVFDSFTDGIIYFFLRGVDYKNSTDEKFKFGKSKDGEYGEERTYEDLIDNFLDAVSHEFGVKHAMDDSTKNGGQYYPLIQQDPDKYLYKEFKKKFIPLLKGLKKKGKRLFLATNSQYSYAKFIVDQCLGEEESKEIFDLRFYKSGKPKFFDPNGQGLSNFDDEKMTPIENWTQVEYDRLKKNENVVIGGIFYLPNCFYQALLNKQSINYLYVGDHIRTDCNCVSQLGGWKSALIFDDIVLKDGMIGKYDEHYGEKWKDEELKYENSVCTYFKEGRCNLCIPNVDFLRYIFNIK